jgi:hypothetical protein
MTLFLDVPRIITVEAYYPAPGAFTLIWINRYVFCRTIGVTVSFSGVSRFSQRIPNALKGYRGRGLAAMKYLKSLVAVLLFGGSERLTIPM